MRRPARPALPDEMAYDLRATPEPALLTALALALALGGAPVKKPVDTRAVEEELVKQHGEAQRPRIHRGLAQVAALWRKEDGDLAAFAREQFLSDPKDLDATFTRFESNLELLDGHYNEIARGLRTPTDLDLGPLQKVDPTFAALDPSAHLVDDFFTSKLAFVALLNFPQATLKEKAEQGKDWSRRQWAEVRLTGRFSQRVPAEVQQRITAATSAGELYVSEYNIWMHHLVNARGERLWPAKLRLISHWNLRDELKADYADPRALDKQRTIVQVMERIVTQTIPAAVVDNPRVDWDPFTNKVTPCPPAEVEADAPPARPAPAGNEPDTRYAKILANYRAMREADPYSPVAPTALARAFDLGAELPEARVTAALTEILESPLVPKVAAEVQKRLGRPLEPQDIWFNGFVARGKIPEAELDAKVRARYPTAEAFARDIPRILQGLGFAPDKARFLAEHIVVDPSRGAGHAMQAMRRGDLPHLRTRVEKEGMNYKGYNIAVHELGHNVEQVFSLYGVDHTLLAGVPNTAFTEALAFVFQARDLELLGLGKPDAEGERLRVLNDFWQAWEIAGVALVDIGVWHWMYEHPNARPAELREAAVKIAQGIWNKHYAPVLGRRDSPQLAVYSHMIQNPLYLFNYPLGHLIAFQIEEQVAKAGKLGPEFERMATYGSVSPDLWMEHATGAPVGAGPLLRATEAALKAR